jgi:hypothetical protein
MKIIKFVREVGRDELHKFPLQQQRYVFTLPEVLHEHPLEKQSP